MQNMLLIVFLLLKIRLTCQSLIYVEFEHDIQFEVNLISRNCSLDTSICVFQTGDTSSDTIDCTSGEVFLIGQHINIGVHNVASYGTQNILVSSYMNEHLSLISSNNVWSTDSTTPYPVLGYGKAGPGPKDFFTPGGPIEGWVVQYSDSSGSVTHFSQGLADMTSFRPTALLVTSAADSSILSVLWTGTYGKLEVTKVVYFSSTSFYVTTSVVVKNIGSEEITDFYYARSSDPDQDSAQFDSYQTENYVQYQQTPTRYTHPNNSYTALVCAISHHDPEMYVSLGTVHPDAHVSSAHFVITNPFLESKDSDWLQYGGSDVQPTAEYAARRRYSDDQLGLYFPLGTVQPGEVLAFDFVYVTQSDSASQALTSLTEVFFVQPTNIVSGAEAILSAAVKVEDNNSYDAIMCSFSMFAKTAASTVSQWHNITSEDYVVSSHSFYMNNATYYLCSTRLDTTRFLDGVVQLNIKAQVGDVVKTAHKGSFIRNEGIHMCFAAMLSSEETFSFVQFDLHSVSVSSSDCVPAVNPVGYAVTSVAFFLEALVDGVLRSRLVDTLFSEPYTAQISSSDLNVPLGYPMCVKAEVQSVPVGSIVSNSTIVSTTTVFCGEVNGTTTYTPPTDIFLSRNHISENAAVGTVIGRFSSVGASYSGDSSVVPQYTYTLVDAWYGYTVLGNHYVNVSQIGDIGGDLPSLNSSMLLLAQTVDYETTIDHFFVIRVKSDSGFPTGDCCFQKDFVIHIDDGYDAYEGVSPSNFSVYENVAGNVDLGTFIVDDPHIVDSPVFLIVPSNDSNHFAVDFESGAFSSVTTFDYEKQKTYVVLLGVINSGEFVYFLKNITVNVIDVNESPTGISMHCVYNVSDSGDYYNTSSLAATQSDCDVLTTASAGDFVGVFSSYDVDANDTHTYVIEDCTYPGLLSISSNGTLYLNEAPVRLSYVQLVSFTIVTTDSGGLQFSSYFSLSLIPAIFLPVVEDTVCYCDEDAPVSSVVASKSVKNGLKCQLNAYMPDGSALSFSLVEEQQQQQQVFKLDSSCSGYVLVNASALRITAQPIYNLRVKVTSVQNLPTYGNLVIHIVNTNQRPVVSSTDIPRYFVSEGVSTGEVVVPNLLSQVFDEDEDVFAADTYAFCCQRTYSIVGGNSALLFAVTDANTGELSVNRSGLNYETESSYVLTMRMTDQGGLFVDFPVELSVLDVPERPYLSTSASADLGSIKEGASYGTVVSGISGIFILQQDSNQTYDVSIVGGNIDYAFYLQSFVIPFTNVTYYVIAVNNCDALHSDVSSKFVLQILLINARYPELHDTANYTVRVVPKYQAPLLRDNVTAIHYSVYDNATQLYAIGVPLLDSLEGLFTSCDFQLVTGDTTMFGLDDRTGQLFINDASSLDHFIQNEYTLNVQITTEFASSVNTVASVETNVLQISIVVSVKNAQQTLSFQRGSFMRLSVPENALVSDHVYVGVKGQPFLFVIDGVAPCNNVSFRVLAVNNDTRFTHLFVPERSDSVTNGFHLRSNSSFDYEITSAYAVTVQASEQHSTCQYNESNGAYASEVSSVLTTINVEIDNVNDRPSIASNVTCYLSQTASAGTVLCALVGTDQDSFANSHGWGKLVYAIDSQAIYSEGVNTNVSQWFNISTVNNVGFLSLRVDSSVSTQFSQWVNVQNASASMLVSLSDGGMKYAVNRCFVRIVVLEALTYTPPLCPSVPMTFSVDENITVGYVLGSLYSNVSSAVRMTSAVTEGLAFALLAGDQDGQFSVDNESGMLSILSSLDYETTSSYQLAVQISTTTVQDIVLSATCLISVQVRDVNEETIFLPQTIYTDENIASGSQLSVSGVLSSHISILDSDAIDIANGVYSLLCVSCSNCVELNNNISAVNDDIKTQFAYLIGKASVCDPIKVNASTGRLSLKSDAVLNYELVQRYDYMATWSSRGVSLCTNLTVRVNDINERPIVSGSTLNISEDVKQFQTYVNATDPDFNMVINFTAPGSYCRDSCGLKYSLVHGAFGMFELNPDNGLLSLVGELDFENRAHYELLIRVTDRNGLGMFATSTIIINIFDVCDCSVVSFSTVHGATAGAMLTSGGEILLINGRNFGPTRSRVASDPSLSMNDTVVTGALVSTTGLSYSLDLLNCSVYHSSLFDNTQVRCVMPSGVGVALRLSLTIVSRYSDDLHQCVATNNNVSVTYIAPVLDSLSNNAGNLSTVSSNSTVVLYGHNFGPVNASFNTPYAVYSNGVNSSSLLCSVLINDIAVSCRTDNMIGTGGANLSWSVVVGSQSSKLLIGMSAFAPPVITSVRAVIDCDALDSSGSSSGYFVVQGKEFGVLASHLVLSFGSDIDSLKYRASWCEYVERASSSNEIYIVKCFIGGNKPYTGSDLVFSLAVAGQSSEMFVSNISFCSPSISTVEVTSVFGTDQLSTSGSEMMHIYGRHFGSDISGIVVEYYSASVVVGNYSATNCTMMTIDSEIVCYSSPGSGSDLVFSITVSGQTAQLFFSKIAYAAPIVTHIATSELNVRGSSISDIPTAGNQGVTLHGFNFGVDMTSIDKVVYHSIVNADVNQSVVEYDVTDSCNMTVPHLAITCNTVSGAGSSLVWSVMRAGRSSVSSVTAYAPPHILSVTTTDGEYLSAGSIVHIIGANFGPVEEDSDTTKYLERVTFGVTGSEYDARDCRVTVAHSQIICTVPGGVGSSLRWRVTIASQRSALSTVRTSYSAPVLSTIYPNSGSTVGGTIVNIRGVSLTTDSRVYFNGVSVSSFAYFNGSTILLTVPAATEISGAGSYPVQVKVGGQLSNALYFQYSAPTIKSVTVMTLPVSSKVASSYMLTITGADFTLNPAVFLSHESIIYQSSCNSVSQSVILCAISHNVGSVYVMTGDMISNQVLFFANVPKILHTGVVDGIARTDGYSTFNPALIVVTGQRFVDLAVNYSASNVSSQNGMVRISAQSAISAVGLQVALKPSQGYESVLICEVASFYSVNRRQYLSEWLRLAALSADVSAIDDEADMQQIVCKLPQGLGSNHTVVVTRSEGNSSISSTLESQTCDGSLESPSSVCFSYLSPTVSQVSSQSGSTGGNYEVTISGHNFSPFKHDNSTSILVGGVEWSVNSTRSNSTTIVVNVPPGQGKMLPITINVGNQLLQYGPFTRSGVSSLLLFSYDPPVVQSINKSISSSSQVVLKLVGSNFGFSPVVRLGRSELTLLSHSHHVIEALVPSGQGKGLAVSVNVSDQVAYVADAFSYFEPIINGMFPAECETVGGRRSSTLITLIGAHFGLEERFAEVSVTLGGRLVSSSDVFYVNSTCLQFYPPEGQGRDLSVVVTVSGQNSSSQSVFEALFSYSEPVIVSVQRDSAIDTAGGTVLTLIGRSFGTSGASVLITDSVLFSETNSFPESSQHFVDERMSRVPCVMTLQSHRRLQCVMPAGLGTNMSLTLHLSGYSVSTNLSYAAPQVLSVFQSGGGRAAGGEKIRVYGDNFGAIRSVSNVTFVGSSGVSHCESSIWLADDSENGYKPYVECVTQPTTVGMKNLTLFVAHQQSPRFTHYRVECKAGSYGMVGEYCTDCGVDMTVSGMSCPTDNLANPVSSKGFYLVEEPLTSERCSAAVTQYSSIRSTCPVSLPCEPASACLGANQCDALYTGSRCNECVSNAFKVNGACQSCVTADYALALLIVTVLLIVFAMRYSARNATAGSLKSLTSQYVYILVDHLQTIALLSQVSRVVAPDVVVSLFNVLSVLNLAPDLLFSQCWSSRYSALVGSFSYKQKFLLTETLPLILLAVCVAATFTFVWMRQITVNSSDEDEDVGAIYGSRVSAVLNRSRAENQEKCPYVKKKSILLTGLMSVYLVCLAFLFAMLLNNALSVFNCLATVPSDGHSYMVSVGAVSSGICYAKGSVQQALAPFGVLSFIVYGVLIPVGIYQAVAFGRRSDTGQFALLYKQYLPDYQNVWLIFTLLRKGLVVVVIVAARGNPVLSLSIITMLQFVNYVIHVYYMPYPRRLRLTIDAIDYRGRGDTNQRSGSRKHGNAALLNTTVAVLLQTVVERSADTLTWNSLQTVHTFDFNYVESLLITSQIGVTLSLLALQSLQLTASMQSFLTGVIFILVIASVLYFLYALYDGIMYGVSLEQPEDTKTKSSPFVDVEAGISNENEKQPVASQSKHVVRFDNIKNKNTNTATWNVFQLSSNKSVSVNTMDNTTRSKSKLETGRSNLLGRIVRTKEKETHRRTSVNYDWLYKSEPEEQKDNTDCQLTSTKTSYTIVSMFRSSLFSLFPTATTTQNEEVSDEGDNSDDDSLEESKTAQETATTTVHMNNPMRMRTGTITPPPRPPPPPPRDNATKHSTLITDDKSLSTLTSTSSVRRTSIGKNNVRIGPRRVSISKMNVNATSTNSIRIDPVSDHRSRYNSFLSMMGGDLSAVTLRRTTMAAANDGSGEDDSNTVGEKKRRQTAKLFRSLRKVNRQSMGVRASVRYDAKQTPIQRQENPIVAARNLSVYRATSATSNETQQHVPHVMISVMPDVAARSSDNKKGLAFDDV